MPWPVLPFPVFPTFFDLSYGCWLFSECRKEHLSTQLQPSLVLYLLTLAKMPIVTDDTFDAVSAISSEKMIPLRVPPFEEFFPLLIVGDFDAREGEGVVARSFSTFPRWLASSRKLQDSSLEHLPFCFPLVTRSLLPFTADGFPSAFAFRHMFLSRFVRS